MSNLRNCSAFILKKSASTILSAMGTIDANAGQHLSVRSFSRTAHLAKSKNFYDDLEIPRSATQSEIKAAYYELSMAYHPDKNKTEHGKLKFRLITEAYEVLGNVRTRRMYDKGLLNFLWFNLSIINGNLLKKKKSSIPFIQVLGQLVANRVPRPARALNPR